MRTIPRRSVLWSIAGALGLHSLLGTGEAVAQQETQAGRLKFEIFKDGKGQFRWRLKAGNGQIIGTSGQGYKAKADCRSAVDSIKRNASTAAVEEVS